MSAAMTGSSTRRPDSHNTHGLPGSTTYSTTALGLRNGRRDQPLKGKRRGRAYRTVSLTRALK